MSTCLDDSVSTFASVSSSSTRSAAGSSGSVGVSLSAASIVPLILCGHARFGNLPCRLYASPIDAGKQRSELDRRQTQDTIDNRRPAEAVGLQLLPDQHQPAAVPHQNLHPVSPLRPEYQRRARERVGVQLCCRQRSQAVRTLPEIDRLGRQQDPRASRQRDHVSSAAARRAMTPGSAVLATLSRRPLRSTTSIRSARLSWAGATACKAEGSCKAEGFGGPPLSTSSGTKLGARGRAGRIAASVRIRARSSAVYSRRVSPRVTISIRATPSVAASVLAPMRDFNPAIASPPRQPPFQPSTARARRVPRLRLR